MCGLHKYILLKNYNISAYNYTMQHFLILNLVMNKSLSESTILLRKKEYLYKKSSHHVFLRTSSGSTICRQAKQIFGILHYDIKYALLSFKN